MKKRRKIVKMRGSKTCGYGAKKKHRGKGSRGGKGFAGLFKHKKTWVRARRPDLLERNVGFTSLQQKGIKPRVKAINVGDLTRVLKNADLKKEVDLADYGYDKLLGSGQMGVALKVRVASFTAKAAEKIQKAGGQIISDEQEIEEAQTKEEND